MIDPLYTARMNEQQRAWFYAEYERARKDEVVGVLLALFLGGFGIHQFYLRRNGLGVLYLLLSWTGIPALIGFVECFFMPGRVREYNAGQAAYIASQIAGGGVVGAPSYVPPVSGSAAVGNATRAAAEGVDRICGACRMPMEAAAAFCPRCGAATV